MRVYYNPETRAVLYTTDQGPNDKGPAGTFLEYSGALPGPLHALIVDENEEIQMPSLAPSIEEAIGLVNQSTDLIRRRFITPIVGQEMIYKEKEAEAKSYLVDQPATLVDYPFIAAEVGVTAPTAYEVAQLYLNLATQWRGVGSQLENLRLTAIGSIEMATTMDEIMDAEQAFLQSIGTFQ